MAGRIARLTPGFRRALRTLGIVAGSTRQRALAASIAALADADALPGPLDSRTVFHPGSAHARRVVGQNLWVLYRFDPMHVDVLAVRDTPPVPAEDE